MKEQAGRVFSISAEHRPVPGCTTSVAVQDSRDLMVNYFALAAHTDISAESYAYPKLILAVDGEVEVYAGTGYSLAGTSTHSSVRQETAKKIGSSEESALKSTSLGRLIAPSAGTLLRPGDALVTPVNVPVGMRSQTGGVYVELSMRKETTMNEAINAGEVFKLADLLPYQEGTIVNMDVAHNSGMKLALMSFDAGTSLAEHAAPGEALIFALDGEGVIGYEGQEHVIHAGENFKFDKNGRHYVRADKHFKMALLLTLD